MPLGTKGITPTKEELVDLYLNRRISKSEIMKIYKIGNTTIDKLFLKYGIETRKLGANQFNNWDFEKVKKVFCKRGYTLLETEYKNSSTRMKYRCHCGNETRIIFSALLTGRGCNECANLIRYAKRRKSYEDVEARFIEKGCKLLSKEYVNSHEKLDYICHCGEKASMTYANFNAGYDCAECKRKRLSGPNNYGYNHSLTDEDRLELGRYEKGYGTWRRKVYKNDKFTCQICASTKSGQLVAHHLEGYKENPDLRTDPNNGVTLCITCHKEFHRIYGYGNNTRKQFEAFKISTLIKGG